MASRYLIRENDTIHQVARRLLGNADQWIVLATFNSLDYPYIDTDPAAVYPDKKVLTTGNTMLVPSDITNPREDLASSDDDIYAMLLGIDIALDKDEDLSAADNGDLKTVSGVENLVAALLRRIRSRLGELVYHPGYGYDDSHIGKVQDVVRIRLIRLSIQQVLLADPRIRTIINMDVTTNADQIDVQVNAQIIGIDDVVPLNLVIAKVA